MKQNEAEWIVYDALYAYCQEMVRRGQPDGQFKKAIEDDIMQFSVDLSFDVTIVT